MSFDDSGWLAFAVAALPNLKVVQEWSRDQEGNDDGGSDDDDWV